MKHSLLWGACVCVSILVAHDLPGAASKTNATAAVRYLPNDQLDEQPRFPKTEQLWKKLDYPLLDPLHNYPVVAAVAITVDAKGNVKSAELLTTNERAFGLEAVKSVKSWRLVPGRKEGVATACSTVATLRAELTPRAGKYNVSRQAWLADPKSQAPK